MAGLETRIARELAAGQPRVIAVFSYRYDAHLVPALLENLAGVVHGWVAYDDRGTDCALSDEPTRRNLLLAAARDIGADWILAADPDERFETALAARIDTFTAAPRNTRWCFDVRELFAPEAYRVDGLWGRKKGMRLFPSLPALNASPAALHGAWVSEQGSVVRRDTGINLYHLNMISPERRQRRRDHYASADPERLHQAIGYDYLADDRGAVLEAIAPGRAYHPPHRDDGRLWSAPGGLKGRPVPDGIENRLHLIATLRQARDPEGACRVARDLAEAVPQDGDLQLLAAAAALDAGAPAAALVAAEAAARIDPGDAAGHFLRSRALAALDRRKSARTAAARSLRLAPGSLLARQQVAAMRKGRAHFAEHDALWRRWAAGPARLHEGADVANRASVAVVVLGHRAPAELPDAVASLCEQKPRPEIVVVNSGGGDARSLLAAHLHRIRLIEVEEPLFAGAVRNIGVDASQAPIVAFLAADCLARPRWVAERLALHRAGAEAVSSPVLPHSPRNPFSKVANALVHRQRQRRTPESEVSHYGVSYARSALVRSGYFPPGLRVGEDSALNGVLRRTAVFQYARKVTTLHRYPTDLRALLRDARERGRRRVAHPPFVRTAGGDPVAEPDWDANAAANLAGAMAIPLGAGARGWRLALWRWLLRRTIRAGQRGAREALASAREAVRLREEATRVAGENCDRAVQLADRALELAPQNLGCLMLCARLRRQRAAAAESAGGDLDAAIVLLRRAVGLRPQDTAPAAALAATLKEAGRLSEAVDAAEFCALIAPNVAQHWELAARLARQARQFRRQRLLLQMALVAGPQRSQPHSGLVACHTRARAAATAESRRDMGERLAAIEARRKQSR